MGVAMAGVWCAGARLEDYGRPVDGNSRAPWWQLAEITRGQSTGVNVRRMSHEA